MAPLSTATVGVIALANVPSLDIPTRVAHFVGVEQRWQMFTRPPHSPAGTELLVRSDGEVHRVDSSNLAVDVRWRRFIDALRVGGTADQWRCLALLSSAADFDGTTRTVVIAVPVGDGHYRAIDTVDIAPNPTGSADHPNRVGPTRCGSTDHVVADSLDRATATSASLNGSATDDTGER